MTIIRAVVNLPSVDTLPRDASQNVFHFGGSATVDDTAFDDITTEIEAFYSTPQVNDVGTLIDDSSISIYLSPILDSTPDACTITFYDVTALGPVDVDGVPISPQPSIVPLATRTFGLATPFPDAAAMFSEVACALTIVATPALVVPIRRRRGRVYIGPLNFHAMGQRDVAGVLYPSWSSDFREHVARSAKRLARAQERIDWAWVIYSRRNAAAYDVSQGYVDNEGDTQRRRGLTATLRTPFDIVGTGATTLP